jgi:simple sugar transport system permease protein
VGNILGSPIGALSLLTINEIIRAAGIDSNIQTVISGALLCFFIVLQSVIIWLRDKTALRLPAALPITRNPESGKGWRWSWRK